jgi:hypothetical protein
MSKIAPLSQFIHIVNEIHVPSLFNVYMDDDVYDAGVYACIHDKDTPLPTAAAATAAATATHDTADISLAVVICTVVVFG